MAEHQRKGNKMVYKLVLVELTVTTRNQWLVLEMEA